VAPIKNDHKEYSLKRIKELPQGKSNIVKEIKPIVMDNLEGYEIVAYGKDDKGREQLVYQVTLFKADGYYYMMLGTATQDFEANLEAFKKLAVSFKQK
jgi:hypothetical protein